MNLKRIVLALAFGGTALATSTAFAQEPYAPEREPLRPNRPLLYSGAGLLAVSYAAPVAVAATSDRPEDKNLYIPVAGPWLDLAERDRCAPNSCETEAIYKGLLVTTGVAHLVGTGLVLSSFIVPEEPARTRTASTKPIIAPAQMGKGGVGLTISGAF